MTQRWTHASQQPSGTPAGVFGTFPFIRSSPRRPLIRRLRYPVLPATSVAPLQALWGPPTACARKQPAGPRERERDPPTQTPTHHGTQRHANTNNTPQQPKSTWQIPKWPLGSSQEVHGILPHPGWGVIIEKLISQSSDVRILLGLFIGHSWLHLATQC